MSRAKEVGTAVGTLACALAIGFAMQSTDHASQRYGVAVVKPPANKSPNAAGEDPQLVGASIMDVHDIKLTSALTATPRDTTPVVTKKVAVVEPVKMKPVENAITVQPAPVQVTCTIDADALPREAAFVRLTLDANCRSNEAVIVHHNGMKFSGKTDADGHLSVTVPALSKSAVFIFEFSDGDGAVAHASVEDITDFQRVVLQWRGTTGFELHAREFGADYGGDGHIWHGVQSDLGRLINREGGVLTTLGHQSFADPLLAEVYSFPSDMTNASGLVDLSVEAIVNQDNCGSEIQAQTLQWDGNARLRTQDVTLEIPGCDTLGDYLVLNNVLDDLKVASN